MVSDLPQHDDRLPSYLSGHDIQSLPSSQTLGQPPPQGQAFTHCGKIVRKLCRGHLISDTARSLLQASWRSETQTRYGYVIKKWEAYCRQWHIDPIHTPVANVLNFLGQRFHEGAGYRSICACRSALNTVVSLHEGLELSDHPLMKRFVKGVFHLRPPLPKYTQVWDVGMVIAYIRSLGCTNDQLSLKDLTMKLTALLSILTAQRISSISYLSVSHMFIEEDKVIFTPVQLSKHHRQGRKILPITIHGYPLDPRLCVIRTLREYMSRRQDIVADSLVLTHRKPRRPATKSSIARWLKQVLRLAGVDSSVFTAHSFRSSSTSSAKAAAIPIATILGKGQWTSERTWRNHYDLELMPMATPEDEEDYTEQLLDAYPPQ